VLPGAGLTGTSWRLRVRVDGPRRSASPAVVVLVNHKHHRMTQTVMHLDRSGRGTLEVPFGATTTQRVTVTLANTSTRFRCHTGGGYSCNGTPVAPHPAFRLEFRAMA
jgi:hypothetical protein